MPEVWQQSVRFEAKDLPVLWEAAHLPGAVILALLSASSEEFPSSETVQEVAERMKSKSLLVLGFSSIVLGMIICFLMQITLLVTQEYSWVQVQPGLSELWSFIPTR